MRILFHESDPLHLLQQQDHHEHPSSLLSVELGLNDGKSTPFFSLTIIVLMSVTTKLKNKSVPHITEETTVLLPEYGFTAVETIGIGTFGAVFLVTDNKGNQYALKKVCLDPNFKNRELEIVSSLYHPNCLRYITHYITKE